MRRSPRRDGLLLVVTLIALLAANGEEVIRHERTRVRGELAPYCPPGEAPALVLGFADLAARLGTTIGEPLECEHGEPGSGDTWLRTTTGLARYRWCTSTPTFSRGREHWALTPRGLVFWAGDRIDPPVDLPLVNNPGLRRSCSAEDDPF